jgi:hypothetical protein
MSYLNKEELDSALQILKEKYNTAYVEVNFGGLIPAFFISCENQNELQERWLYITEFFAANFQTNLKEEFSTWNIYLFFLVKGNVDNSLKYKIENDTFSSRKVVVEPQIDFNIIVEEHIINKLQFNITNDSHVNKGEFTANDIIGHVLSEKSLKGKRQINDESRVTLDEIVDAIKNQPNEI